MKPIVRPWDPAFLAQWTMLFLLPIVLHPASMGKIVGGVNPYWATALVIPLLFGAGYLVGRSLDVGIPHVERISQGEFAAAWSAAGEPARSRAKAPARTAARARPTRKAA